MNPKILVTGLNGLIGWNVYSRAPSQFEVYGTYRKEVSSLRRKGVFRIDLESDSEVFSLVNKICPDFLIHSWAMCDLDVCEENPEMAYRINVEGTERFIEASRRARVKKLIYISTDHVFGGHRGRYDESDRPDPIHVYGRTKAEAEERVIHSGLPYLIIRPGLVIGKSLQGTKGPRDFLIHRIRQGKPIHYFVDEWRTPIHAADMAAEVLALSVSELTGVIHLAGDRLMNRFELARHLAVSAGFALDCIFPRKREEDRWAHIRPANIGLSSRYRKHLSFDLNFSEISIQ